MARATKTTPKTTPNLDYEKKAGFPNLLIAGADEVGRGCIAGPVVAAAVILPPQIETKKHPWISQIADSKLLNAETRTYLAPLIADWVFAWGLGFASVEEIARLNIFQASHLAIVRSVENLTRPRDGLWKEVLQRQVDLSSQNGKIRPDHLLIDGKFLPKVGLPCLSTAIIKGDQKSLSIASASILAKVWRDQVMTELDLKYPGYGLAKNKGYPTSAHAKALDQLGAVEIHRPTFKTVVNLASHSAHKSGAQVNQTNRN